MYKHEYLQQYLGTCQSNIHMLVSQLSFANSITLAMFPSKDSNLIYEQNWNIA